MGAVMQTVPGDLYRTLVGERGTYDPPPEQPLCPFCRGSKFISKHVRVGHPDFGLPFPCRCQLLADGPTLANFIVGANVDLKLAKEAVIHWLDGQGPALVVLMGPRGVGKTHLALAAVYECLRRFQSCLMITDRELDSMLRQSFDDNRTDDILRTLRMERHLIIDDLGVVARDPTGTLAALMDSIMDDRWKLAREGDHRTLITTNLRQTDLPARMASRLNDATRARALEIAAPDYRRVVREE